MYVSSMFLFFCNIVYAMLFKIFFKEIYSRSKKTAKKILVFFSFHFIAYVFFS